LGTARHHALIVNNGVVLAIIGAHNGFVAAFQEVPAAAPSPPTSQYSLALELNLELEGASPEML
jgi:hypothetical protein